MHLLCCPHHTAAVDLGHGLMTQADAEGRNRRGQLLEHIEADAGLIGVSGAGGQQDGVGLQLADLAALLAEQELPLHVDEAVIQWLATESYDPEYGARPLRRLLRRRLENPLATELLEERYQGAAGVQVSLEEGTLRFSPVL